MALLGPSSVGHTFYVPPEDVSFSSEINFSSATTEGADVLLANISVLVDSSSATTDGADILVGQVSVIVSVSSATTDGADVLAGNVSVIVAVSSATTDGADTLAGLVSPLITITSATTDGADVLISAVSVIIEINSSTIDGPDVFNGQVDTGSSADFSSSVTEGADLLSATVDNIQNVDGGGGRKYWQPYWIEKKDWEKIPAVAVQAIERVARSKKVGEDAEMALIAEMENYQARYGVMLQMLKQNHLNSLAVLKKQQLAQIQAIQDEEDDLMMMMY